MEPPTHFKNLQNELTQRYNIIISEVVQTYPNYKLYSANSTGYNQNIVNLEKLQEDIFLMKNNLTKSTDGLQKNIKIIDNKIFSLGEDNKTLQEELDLLTNSDNAAHGRLTDSKYLYNRQLLGNWLLLGLVLSGTYVVFKR
jgi:hypothetical protein